MTELAWMVSAFVLGALVLLFGFALLAGLTSAKTTKSRLARGEMPAEELASAREELVAHVLRASTEQGAAIELKAHWRSTGRDRAQQFVILRQPLEDRILHRALDKEAPIAFVQLIAQDVLSWPPAAVKLNSRDWQRSAMPDDARITIREVSGGVVQVGNRNTATVEQRIDADLVAALINALRTDAATLAPRDAEQAESFADSLEADMHSKRWTSITTTFAAIAGAAASGTAAWASTVAALGG